MKTTHTQNLTTPAFTAQTKTLEPPHYQDFGDQLLYQRAFEAVLWALPVADTLVMRHMQAEWGMKEGAVFYFEKRASGKTEVITFNNQTPYVFGTFSTRNGPLVFEVPPAGAKAKLSGSIFDLWYLPMEDIGPAGADQGKGAKYLALPPDYKGEVPAGYIALHSRTYDVHMLFRSIPTDEGDEGWKAAVQYAKTLKFYPLSEAAAPKPTEFVDATSKPFSGTPHFDLSYFDYINQTVQEEPLFEHDKVMFGLLASIGIQKGKPFKPDAKTAAIFDRAARDAKLYLIHKMETMESFGEPFWPDRRWRTLGFTPEIMKSGVQWVFPDRVDYDWRAYGWYFWGVGIQKRVGAAATYTISSQDAEGKVLDPAQTYRVHLPKDVPIDDFWELIAYSIQTRSYIDTPANKIAVSSKTPNLQKNADGSVDLYLGPQAPAGKESNWISTKPGEGYFVGFRFYGPQKAFYDKVWTPSDIEKVK
ncbi:MAG: DUF1254 domain-containing protein [Sulfurimicrobium sp.]|nr:DUF1254 domain-containing protein [Sulfurimicrobium sp.]